MAVVPMFPLGMTVLPGGVVPLQVFEPRYVALVRDLLADDERPPEFGIVMIERGWEVGGGDDRAHVGTMVRIVDMQALPDERYAMVCVGVRRIRVGAWLPDDPYPRADVDEWPDEGEPPADLERRVAALHAKVRELNGLVRELGHGATPPDDEIGDDPHLAVYHLASLSPIGPADRHRLLTATGIGDRCDVLDEVLDDARAVLEFHRS